MLGLLALVSFGGLVALSLGLRSCGSITDTFPVNSVYNSTLRPVTLEITGDGLQDQKLKLPPLQSLVIAPGDKCRFAKVEMTGARGQSLGVFEGSLCPYQGLTVTDSGITISDSTD